MDIEDDDIESPQNKRLKSTFKIVRMFALLLWWMFFTVALILNEEVHHEKRLVSVSTDHAFEMSITGDMLPLQDLFGVELKGPIVGDASITNNPGNGTLKVKFEGVEAKVANFEKTHSVWTVKMQKDISGRISEVVKRAFELPNTFNEFTFSITAMDIEGNVPLEVTLIPDMVSSKKSVIIAAILLVSLYILIIWDIVDRVFAALLASTTALAVLAWLNERPSIETIVSWIDIQTLILLFGMMILVAILSDTGIFDVVAVFAYKISRGHPWPMIYTICMITGVLSAFLDNVTMMLLMTPVTIRLCEVMNLNVINVLIVVVVFSNIGGSMTPVGDPPNVIIATNVFVQNAGVDFMTFTVHMFPVVFVCLVVSLFQVRLQLGEKGIRSPPEEEQKKIQRELKAWRHAQNAIGAISAREQDAAQAMNEKIQALKEKYKDSLQRQHFGLKPTANFVDTLSEMEARYPIRNKPLLIKSSIALSFAVCLFCLHSLPAFHAITLEWIALLAALLLLILSASDDISSVIERIEWPTLLFFAALFVMMESLAEMGLIEWIGLQTVNIIEGVSDTGRLAVAIILILWISGLTSAFVDNIPITQMMIKICIHIYLNIKLPLTPLIWSLVLGACLGGNGTLIGSSSNVVCAGIAAQHGYKFTFYEFFKIAFPVMLTTLFIGTGYLLLCHVAGTWHSAPE